MHRDLFYHLGKLIHKSRWLVILLWLILFAVCVAYATRLMLPYKAIGFNDPNSQSAQANQLLNNKLGYSYNQFIVMYKSDKSFTTHPALLDEIKKSLDGLNHFPVKHQIVYPTTSNKQISEDKHSAYAVVLFNSKQEADHTLLEQFKKAVKQPPHLDMHVGGEPIFLEDTKKQTEIDLYKAEYIATPAAIITMLIVFGSIIAASIPVVLGGICALAMLLMLYCLAQFFSLSVFTINIALLLGLCLSLDYALLMVSRYRDELHHGRSIPDAIAVTVSTAGKAVFFSGLAVLVSLSALLLFPINILFSVGLGGIAAVTSALAVALILLPAVLAVLNHKINLLPIGLLKFKRLKGKSYWRWLVKKVVKRPSVFFACTLIFLLSLGYPFLHAQFGISDFRILPKNLESRQVFDTFEKDFGESKLAPVLIIVQTPHKNMLSEKNIGILYDYAQQIKKDPRTKQLNSIVTTEPQLTKKQYQMLYTHPEALNPELKKFLQVTTNKDLTVLTLVTKQMSNSTSTYEFIKELRKSSPGDGMTVKVTGTSANTMDVKQSIKQVFPYAFLWIVGFTYIILLVLLRSVILPFKAILTTIISLCASYGVLVLVIQEGYLHHLLNFEPQGMLDISLLIIIFCALFGISMDYEVFLLTRIKEYYEQTADNTKSIEFGIERSSKIITSAAIIVILICFSFMSADILMVKAFGLGIAIAVFVDAFIIRTVLVPATMALLKKWNWYLPKWLGKILPKIAFDPERSHH